MTFSKSALMAVVICSTALAGCQSSSSLPSTPPGLARVNPVLNLAYTGNFDADQCVSVGPGQRFVPLE